MSGGIGAIANGGQWLIYDLATWGEFPKKPIGRVNVLDDESWADAHVLDHFLGRLGVG